MLQEFKEILKEFYSDPTVVRIAKDLTILELLKKKEVDIPNIKFWLTVPEYKEDSMRILEMYNWYCSKKYELTEDEFNLIKEWLEREE